MTTTTTTTNNNTTTNHHTIGPSSPHQDQKQKQIHCVQLDTEWHTYTSYTSNNNVITSLIFLVAKHISYTEH